MTTKAELEKMVKERSIEVRRYWNERAHHFHAPRMQQEYEAGAQFVTGILMPDIERLKEENNVRNIPLFKIEIDIIKKELSEANARIDSLDKENNELLNLMAQINAEDEIKIQSLKDENKRMKEVIKCCDSDYWFMINLIEHYSTNKDDALKDCLERMKFRKPMFKTALNQGEGEK